jgi:hypothetical protein
VRYNWSSAGRPDWSALYARIQTLARSHPWTAIVGLPVVLVVALASGLVGLAGEAAPAGRWRSVPHSVPPNVVADYQFSTGFSAVQGGGQWLYQQWDGTRYTNMTWDPAGRQWRGACRFCLITRTGMHPDTKDAVLAWRAPRAGHITIVGTMGLANSATGDGVRTVIKKRTGSTVTKIWPSQQYQEIRPNFVAQHLLMTDVRAGDLIYFQANEIGTSAYDTLSWDPRISYDYQPEFTLDGAELVMRPADFQRVGITVAQDSSLSVVPNGTDFDFYHSGDFGRAIQKFRGELDQPAEVGVYSGNRFTNPRGLGGRWWLENIYRTNDGKLLAFCHIEDADVATTGWWAIGLAYSTDGGNTFRMLGEIVSQHIKDTGPNHNIFGVPYVVKDGYFYIYYGEPAASAARAPVGEVLDAASRGTVSDWHKYYRGGWTQNAMGGMASNVIAGTGAAYGTHGDAAYSTYLNRYILAGYAMAGVFLTFSTDAVCYEVPSWTLPINRRDSLAPYETIVDADGSDNAVVGSSFYLYYGYRFKATGVTHAQIPAVWRWLYRQKVTLNRAAFDHRAPTACAS